MTIIKINVSYEMNMPIRDKNVPVTKKNKKKINATGVNDENKILYKL